MGRSDDRGLLYLKAKILTVSDGVAFGTRRDQAGEALAERLMRDGWDVVERLVVSDGLEEVATSLQGLAGKFHGLIVTTGGTGFGPRDRTPEGTLSVIDREAPGLAEAMRLVNPLGRLSRSVAGTLDGTLVLNTPGSARGCIECLEAVIDVLPHAVRLLVDNGDPHPTGEGNRRPIDV
jgi:molybdenum cofactor synthesis domain-containing protein